MRTGILGGTFNPVHIGHLILAEEIREKLRLDRVVFVPTYIPPHKASKNIAPAADRYAMIKAAIRANPCFDVSDVEIRRKGASYTIDTLRELKERYPRDEMYFITGSDLLNYLDKWKDLKHVIALVKFVVATRPGYPLEDIPSYIKTVAIRAVDVSAYEIRQCVKKGLSFRYLVPDPVFAYINKRKLYR
ncbi:MAG TPA: nicotinate-nucleotide adenylyltransferase [Candidatus Omnitrophota bacterium]|nr:nicotinate-nucleotide adenylyltransferase [Candidatus Omnitrophota bacterium]HQQ06656.1 nicotinate-nucleotide adenylyltransferase [Candidatus Omnitrophota bacterium]